MSNADNGGITRSYFLFDTGPGPIRWWQRVLAFLRIKPLPSYGIPNDAVITSATLTIYSDVCDGE